MIIGVSGKIGSGKDLVGDIVQYLVFRYSQKMNISFDTYMDNFYWNKAEDLPEWQFVTKKFAGKLKQITAILLGCTVEGLESRAFKNKDLGESWQSFKPRGKVENVEYTDHILFTSQEEAIEYAKNQFDYDLEAVPQDLTPRKILQLLGTEAGREVIHPNIWVNALFADYHKTFVSRTLQGGQEFLDKSFPNWVITDVRFPNEAQGIKDRKGILIRINRGDGNTGDHLSETALDDYKDWDYIIDNNGTVQDLIEKVETILIKSNIIYEV